MAKRRGRKQRNGSGNLDIVSVAQEIAKRQSEIAEARQALDAEEAELTERVSAMIGGATAKPAKKSKRGRKAGVKNGSKRGRKPGSGLIAILVRDVLPDHKSEAMELSAIESAAKKAGWKTDSETPQSLLSQALGSAVEQGTVKRVGRGEYRLTAKGFKARVKVAQAAKAEAKAEAKNGAKVARKSKKTAVPAELIAPTETALAPVAPATEPETSNV